MKARGYEFELLMIGEGEERDSLEKAVRQSMLGGLCKALWSKAPMKK